MQRQCFACGAILSPFHETTYTAHEFKCGKKNPDMIPLKFKDRHEQLLKGETRSEAAFRGVETRRKNGGKNAPRKSWQPPARLKG